VVVNMVGVVKRMNIALYLKLVKVNMENVNKFHFNSKYIRNNDKRKRKKEKKTIITNFFFYNYIIFCYIKNSNIIFLYL